MDSKKTRLAYIEGWLSVIANIVLFIIKYWAGIVSGSIALITDAWHSLSDSVSSIAVIVGTKVSSKPADEHHPFGHGRAEWIASIVIGVLLAIVAFNFLLESINNLRIHAEAKFGTIALVVTILSILIKEASAQYAFYTARKTGFLSLKADGWHHRSDAISSVLILIGIFISPYMPSIDGILGIVISLFIFYTSYSIFKEATSTVLGEAPDDKLIKQLKKSANRSAGFDLQLHHVLMHKYGSHTEVSFHICLPHKMSVEEAHKVARKIELDLFSELKVSATTHTDPDNLEINIDHS